MFGKRNIADCRLNTLDIERILEAYWKAMEVTHGLPVLSQVLVHSPCMLESLVKEDFCEAIHLALV